MFTGIVENLGIVLQKKVQKNGMSLVISSSLPAKTFKKGTSILVNGVCLTVEVYDIKKKAFTVFLVEETLSRTVFKSVQIGEKLNLESSLTLQKPLAGHLVLGHTDFVAKILEEAPQLRLLIPEKQKKYFPEKGSITVHGVSLTIAKKTSDFIEIALIPETLKSTNLGLLKKGGRVHIEIDVLARYLESLLSP